MIDAGLRHQVERRSNLSLREFRKQYFVPGKPVVITDAIEQWPARSLWTFEYFRTVLGAAKVEVSMDPLGSSKVELTLAQYLGFILQPDWDANRYFYLTNWNFHFEFPKLLEHFDTPKYFRDWFRLAPPALRPSFLLWLFMGPSGSYSRFHTDVWSTHAWLAQLVGHKRWFLCPPGQDDYLYGKAVDPENPDLERYPLFAKATVYETVIGPGDTIFVPSRWSHKVTSIDASISLTQNFMGLGCLRSASKQYAKTYLAPTIRELMRRRAGGRRTTAPSGLSMGGRETGPAETGRDHDA